MTLHLAPMQELLRHIVGGDLASGERLPPVSVLADRHRVSSGTIRESLRALGERGLVTVRQGDGSRVNHPAVWKRLDFEVARAAAEMGVASMLCDYRDCEILLEMQAAVSAARQRDSAMLDRLNETLELMRPPAPGTADSANALRRFYELDARFHAALVGAVGNPVVAEVSGCCLKALIPAAELRAHVPTDFEQHLDEHLRLVEAIGCGDQHAAALAVRQHFAQTEARLRERPSRA